MMQQGSVSVAGEAEEGVAPVRGASQQHHDEGTVLEASLEETLSL